MDATDQVRRAVLDYAEGWFLGDGERMARALHPAFIKRRAVDEGDGFETFDRDDLLEFIENGIGVDRDCTYDIVVDHVSESIASARCVSCDYVDLLHLGRFDEGWMLIHVYYRHR